MLDRVTRSLTAFFFFPMQNTETRGRKETLNSTTKHHLHIYLFVNLPYAQLKETSWVQQNCWPPADAETVKQNPACHKEQDMDGWEFPRGDGTAWERALLLLRQNADVSVRRRQALWSAMGCILQPQLDQKGYINSMVVPGLPIYRPGSIIFRWMC